MQWLIDLVTDRVHDELGVRAKIWQDTPQVIVFSTWTRYNFDTTAFSKDVTVDLVNDQLIIEQAGYYALCSCCSLSNLQVGVRFHSGIRVNGNYVTFATDENNIANDDPRLPSATIQFLNVGDFIELWLWHTNGGVRLTVGQEFGDFLAIHLLSK